MGRFIWVNKWLSDECVEGAAPVLCAGNQDPPASALISKAKKCQVLQFFGAAEQFWDSIPSCQVR